MCAAFESRGDVFAAQATDRGYGQGRCKCNRAQIFESNRGSGVGFGLGSEHGARAQIIGSVGGCSARFGGRSGGRTDDFLWAKHAARFANWPVVGAEMHAIGLAKQREIEAVVNEKHRVLVARPNADLARDSEKFARRRFFVA